MANFASYLNTADSPPSSVSTSYGGEENYFDGSYMDRVCNDFMKAGARGVSIFFSSGDYGVGGNGQEQCQNGYIPLWPAQCPWITSVGGTMFQNGQEVVAYYSSIQGAPGGGFSNHFPTPSYQQADVTAYEKFDGDRAKGYFNPNGRGYPDVSLVSINFRVIVNNKLLSVLGTSAAAPSWAALVSVLNDYRKSLGKPNLGFLNPLLYSAKGKSALRDVTSGHNQGCGLNGFPATTGWDPASGLGSLDFAKMRTVVAST